MNIEGFPGHLSHIFTASVKSFYVMIKRQDGTHHHRAALR